MVERGVRAPFPCTRQGAIMVHLKMEDARNRVFSRILDVAVEG